jgi:hypothetical protein
MEIFIFGHGANIRMQNTGALSSLKMAFFLMPRDQHRA